MTIHSQLLFFIIGVSSLLWIQVGILGVYLSTWNTPTHTERWQLICKHQFSTPGETFKFLTFGLLLSLLGPVILIMSMISFAKYRNNHHGRFVTA
ncbi:MAG: hypothetical protein KBB54_01975 [Candidatus Pacebacteria bacterium]|nr:hypothetical protein [Candidatus Paceibacterota bacterium]MBP9818682.1 hypothetical protein [Candidatus Paceibacterota bacterium]